MGNGGVLLIPRGQKGLLYSMPETKEETETTQQMKSDDDGGDGEKEAEQMRAEKETVDTTE